MALFVMPNLALFVAIQNTRRLVSFKRQPLARISCDDFGLFNVPDLQILHARSLLNYGIMLSKPNKDQKWANPLASHTN